MKNVTISPIRRTHSALRFICPVQSWSQFVSAAIYLAVGLLVCGIVVYRIHPAALAFTMWGGVIGGVYLGLSPALPAHMELTTRGEARHFMPAVCEQIRSFGFVECGSSSAGVRYRSKMPRWARWDEQELELAVSGHTIQVNGPIICLRLLEKKLKRSEL